LLYLKKNIKEQNGVIVVDYSQDSRFTKDDFFDVDHLADTGAKKWSKIISESFF